MDHSYGTLDILNKEIANMRNEQKRHCRIGKVRPKITPASPRISDLLGGIRIKQPYPGITNLPSQPQYMSKCGCKVGTACGNVACPHRLVAVC